MAHAEKPMNSQNLTDVALDLFKERGAQSGISSHQLAMNCFRDAKIFLDAAELVHSGKLNFLEEDTNPLDVAFAPNLKRTHPINLMSRAWGNLAAVHKAFNDLDANPKAESYEPHGWGKAEVNQARALFPAVIQRAKQMVSAK
jgi:hypothetical protein